MGPSQRNTHPLHRLPHAAPFPPLIAEQPSATTVLVLLLPLSCQDLRQSASHNPRLVIEKSMTGDLENMTYGICVREPTATEKIVAHIPHARSVHDTDYRRSTCFNLKQTCPGFSRGP